MAPRNLRPLADRMLRRIPARIVLPAVIVALVIGSSTIGAKLELSLTASCGYGSSNPPVVISVAPNQGSTAGATNVSIGGTGFCNGTSAVEFGPGSPAASYQVVNDTLIKAVSPTHAAGTVDILVTNPVATSAISSADQFTFAVPPPTSACTTTQHRLAGSNGSTWSDLDIANLSLSFTPTANSILILGGNADLWTSTAGYNQDLGMAVSGGLFPTVAGQPEGWKESGGSNGAYSPNAAFVQTVVRVQFGIPYTVKLVWKSNRADSGSIWAGAGPIGGRYSTTCVNYRLVPLALDSVRTRASTNHYVLVGSDGATWRTLDATNLSVTYTAPSDGMVLISANADLWTSRAGYNQDLGISVSGAGYPTSAGQPEMWKESGGNGGTFSPNAAFGQTALPLLNGATITAALVWKTSRPDPAAIFSGAGPIGGKYSATSLTLLFLPTGQTPIDTVSTSQYSLPSSDGATWQALDFHRFTGTFTPTNDCQVVISGNADLFTANGGINQDLGVTVSGGAFPTVAGQPEAWKESGGNAGTYSPNAAFAQITENLSAGQPYTFQLVWKAGRLAFGTTIFAGAGPIGGKFSPTHLTLVPIGC